MSNSFHLPLRISFSVHMAVKPLNMKTFCSYFALESPPNKPDRTTWAASGQGRSLLLPACESILITTSLCKALGGRTLEAAPNNQELILNWGPSLSVMTRTNLILNHCAQQQWLLNQILATSEPQTSLPRTPRACPHGAQGPWSELIPSSFLPSLSYYAPNPRNSCYDPYTF